MHRTATMSQRPQRSRLPAVAPHCAPLRALAWALTGALVRATVLVLAAAEPAGAAPDITGTWSVQTGEVSYRVRHIMHGAEGISREVRGQATCAGGVCMLALSVPVASFVTRDPDRDRDMRAVTRAAQHPMV
ncbi:MAG: hypothetical protein HY342_03400, partial [Candidatus Lambdaproteobacteria bacterium]|nr:hypothetical protein [Candidatus Lambdaproteobacteria bacterium]